LSPTGNRVVLEFIDIFDVMDTKLVEHWASMNVAARRYREIRAQP
jgi:predicted SnoaL-like aldol condensation-catalyzing enzyme